MELKYEWQQPSRLETKRSNRTFMELKSHLGNCEIRVNTSSNRTFMELKL